MHGHQKLLVVKWLGLSITVRIRVSTWDREWIFHSFFKALLDERWSGLID